MEQFPQKHRKEFLPYLLPGNRQGCDSQYAVVHQVSPFQVLLSPWVNRGMAREVVQHPELLNHRLERELE